MVLCLAGNTYVSKCILKNSSLFTTYLTLHDSIKEMIMRLHNNNLINVKEFEYIIF